MNDHTQNSEKPISDELINAYIDHQITNEDRIELLSHIKQDQTLANRICAMKQLKVMTRHAFEDIPEPPARNVPVTRLLPRIAAVVTIFTLGLLIGIAGVQSYHSGQSSAINIVQESATKVLVHLTSADPESALNTLDNLQKLLNDYRQKQQPVTVEVVANGEGVKLLSPGSPAIAERIARLSEEHDNLTIAACKNTIDQIRISTGRPFKLLPQVQLIESGVVQVIQRQRDGWTYIRG